VQFHHDEGVANRISAARAGLRLRRSWAATSTPVRVHRLLHQEEVLVRLRKRPPSLRTDVDRGAGLEMSSAVPSGRASYGRCQCRAWRRAEIGNRSALLSIAVGSWVRRQEKWSIPIDNKNGGFGGCDARRPGFSSDAFDTNPARMMLASRWKPENMCSRRVFPSLTQAV
jgi:hypothetical protein